MFESQASKIDEKMQNIKCKGNIGSFEKLNISKIDFTERRNIVYCNYFKEINKNKDTLILVFHHSEKSNVQQNIRGKSSF